MSRPKGLGAPIAASSDQVPLIPWSEEPAGPKRVPVGGWQFSDHRPVVGSPTTVAERHRCRRSEELRHPNVVLVAWPSPRQRGARRHRPTRTTAPPTRGSSASAAFFNASIRSAKRCCRSPLCASDFSSSRSRTSLLRVRVMRPRRSSESGMAVAPLRRPVGHPMRRSGCPLAQRTEVATTSRMTRSCPWT